MVYMAKLLIIEDHLEIAKEVQKDLAKINKDFLLDENVFCIEKCDDKFVVLPIMEAKDLNRFREDSVDSCYKKVMEGILAFIEENKNERILILIDDHLMPESVLLFKSYIPKVDSLSAWIYNGLVMLKNKQWESCRKNGQYFDESALCFIIYSHNVRFAHFSAALHEIFDRLPEEDIKYFPEECYKIENISLVEGGASDIIEGEPYPLPEPLVEEAYTRIRLPKEYREFLKDI